MASLKSQYKNQVDRIRRALQQSSKRGFVFSDEATLKNIVKEPKRITAGTIRRLKNLTAKEIRKKYATEFVDKKTGEIYTPEYGEKYGRYHNKEEIDTVSIDAADTIIDNFVNHVGQWVIFKKGGKGMRDYSMRDYAIQWLSALLSRYPKQLIARGLQKAASSGNWISTTEVYQIGVVTAINRIASHIDLPKTEMISAEDTQGYEGEFYDMEEYTQDNVYYSDLYTF